MQTADTSVVVASLIREIDGHQRAFAAVAAADELRLIDHVLLESYSVLTRLPGVRLSADRAEAILADAFGGRPLTLPPAQRASVVRRLAHSGVVGGAVYDGLIGLTAVHHDAPLLTLDRRAARTYAELGVRTRQL